MFSLTCKLGKPSLLKNALLSVPGKFTPSLTGSLDLFVVQ